MNVIQEVLPGLCSDDEGCHRQISSRGLCTRHYQRAKKAQTLPPLKPRAIVTCGHSDRPHAGKGMCHSCYMTKWTREHPESNTGPGWVKRNPERGFRYLRNGGLKRRHGLTFDDYERMWRSQRGRCANESCSFTSPLDLADRRVGLHIDHDHKSGKLRELLCHACNLALGCVDDDSDRLLGLVAYLEKHRIKGAS